MNTSLIKSVMGQSHVGHLQSTALIIFLALFIMMMVWIFWPGSKSYYEKIANDLIKGE